MSIPLSILPSSLISFILCFFLFTALLYISSEQLEASQNSEKIQMNAAADNNTNFLSYDNDTLGFQIQTPSDWEVFNFPNSTILVRFTSPFENDLDRYKETVDVSLLIINNTSLEEIVANTTEGLKGSLNDFQLIESNQTTILNYPAHKLVYIYSDPIIGISKAMIFFIMQDERYLYTINYFAKPFDYNGSLPLVQKMVDSFSLYP